MGLSLFNNFDFNLKDYLAENRRLFKILSLIELGLAVLVCRKLFLILLRQFLLDRNKCLPPFFFCFK